MMVDDFLEDETASWSTRSISSSNMPRSNRHTVMLASSWTKGAPQSVHSRAMLKLPRST
jgi:hypothetical protein